MGMKVMCRSNFAMRGIEAQVDVEIQALQDCADAGRCRHVLRFFDVVEERDHVYIRTEICACDLLRFTTWQPDGQLMESDMRIWARQLLTGLGDLHELGFIHRDIKPENLLCTSNGTLKIADFGWCARLSWEPSSLAGTLQYMAPEVLGEQCVQTEAVDVWSAGVTIFQLLTGHHLLTTYLGPGATGLTIADPQQANQVKLQRLLTEINEQCPLHEDARPEHLSSIAWDFLRMLVVPEVAERATVIEGLGHTWLTTETCPDAAPIEAEEEVSILEPSLSSPMRHQRVAWPS